MMYTWLHCQELTIIAKVREAQLFPDHERRNKNMLTPRDEAEIINRPDF